MCKMMKKNLTLTSQSTVTSPSTRPGRRGNETSFVVTCVKNNMGIIVFLETIVFGEVKKTINKDIVTGDTNNRREVVGKALSVNGGFNGDKTVFQGAFNAFHD
ncbi:hypothetical protein HanRHA438_Chr16g0786861 [Helianthus annuus]|nr:hypothetical protein HanRHA438_Chr16g0786861 [Helianthus annuus]